jgi:hypothetical protein
MVVTSGDEELKAAGIVSLLQAPGSPVRQVWSPVMTPKELSRWHREQVAGSHWWVS